MGLFDFFSSDIAIDLGTANTLIIYKDKIVVDEPPSSQSTKPLTGF
jgi:rod shape-determining protein MreB and related proteins